MIVGDRRKKSTDDGDVVLIIIRVGVLALGPLDDVLGVANPHDGSPGSRTRAVAGIIRCGRSGAGGDGAIVIKPDRMADLMRTGLSHELGAGAYARVDKARDIRLSGGTDTAERADIGLAARTGGVLVRTEDDTHAVIRVPGARALEAFHAGIFGGHIDIELGVVLGDASPDVLDGSVFCVAELGGIGIKRKRGGREGGLGECGIPAGAGGGMTREIEVDLPGGGRATVQDESLRSGIARSSRHSGHVGTDRRLQAGAHVKRAMTRGRDMQVVIAIAGLDEIFPRHAGDIRRLFPFGDAGEEGRTIKRRCPCGGGVRRRTCICLGRRLRGRDRLGRGGHGLGDATERNRAGLGTLIGLRGRRDRGDHRRGDGSLRRHDDRASDRRDIDGGVFHVFAAGRQEKDRTGDSQSEEACSNLELARGHKKLVSEPHRMSSRL